MNTINEMKFPAFLVIDKEKNTFQFNDKFINLDEALQEKIKNNYLSDIFSFYFNEKSYQILEISQNMYIILQTEQSQSIREATRHSMALQMRILNELGEGLFIIDKTGKIIFANPSAEKILELNTYEIMGQSFTNFIHPEEERIRVERILQKVTGKDKAIKSTRFETQIKNRENMVYLLVYYSIMLTNESLEGALITIYDISDMKKLTKEIQERSNELIQAEKLTSIGLLASGISHELNNPLAFIISNTSTLEDYIKTYFEEWEKMSFDEISNNNFNTTHLQILSKSKLQEIELIKRDIIEILNANQRGLTRLSDVITDLRKFSHTNSSDPEKTEKLNILEPVKLALNLLSYELKSIDVQFVVENPDFNYLIKGNSKLYQIFLNILYNASQAISEKFEQKSQGIINIKVFEKNSKIVIQIADNGIGINEKALPRLFDPFYTTKPPGIGTGLGLSISQRIINDLGGFIVAESGTVLSGATFTLYFPIYET